METERRPEPMTAPACRWRTSRETLELIEALERIEALLLRFDERLGRVESLPATPMDAPARKTRAEGGTT